jgi:RES domain-containing protein
MIIYRIVDTQYKEDVSGYGAKLYGGRWNPIGRSVVYCAEHISLCMLESMIYMMTDLSKREFSLVKISIPNNNIQSIDYQSLKKKWIKDLDYTQWVGAQFLNQNGFILKVPSAIVEEEFNYLINPEHINFADIKIISAKPFIFDERLFH